MCGGGGSGSSRSGTRGHDVAFDIMSGNIIVPTSNSPRRGSPSSTSPSRSGRRARAAPPTTPQAWASVRQPSSAVPRYLRPRPFSSPTRGLVVLPTSAKLSDRRARTTGNCASAAPPRRESDPFATAPTLKQDAPEDGSWGQRCGAHVKPPLSSSPLLRARDSPVVVPVEFDLSQRPESRYLKGRHSISRALEHRQTPLSARERGRGEKKKNGSAATRRRRPRAPPQCSRRRGSVEDHSAPVELDLGNALMVQAVGQGRHEDAGRWEEGGTAAATIKEPLEHDGTTRQKQGRGGDGEAHMSLHHQRQQPQKQETTLDAPRYKRGNFNSVYKSGRRGSGWSGGGTRPERRSDANRNQKGKDGPR